MATKTAFHVNLMANGKRWIIDARIDGRLDLTAPQPQKFFGMAAITGITEDEMAKTVWRHTPDAVLDDRDIARWAARIDPRFIARERRRPLRPRKNGKPRQKPSTTNWR